MDLVIAIDGWELPFVAIGVGYLALALWLLVLDFPSRLNRAFALYLFLDGVRQFGRIFDRSTPSGYALQMESALLFVTAPFALAYFMLTYEERFGSLKWRRRALLPLIAGALLLAGAVLYEPAWYSTHRELGPIGHLAAWLNVITPCVAALLFGREATRHAADAPRRHALLLASLAFALGPLFSAVHLLVPGLMNASASEQASRLAALLPLGLLAFHLARVARGGDAILRREARHFLSWLSMPVATAILWSATLATPFEFQLWLMSGLMSAWMLALPLLATYAIVRHQLLGIDVKLRFAISKSSVAAVFIAVFFVASEAAQQFFGDTLGSTYVGIAAAGALVFALAPLQRAAERLAEKAVPVAAAPIAVPSAGVEGRRAVFVDAVRRSLRDGAVTREEETYLARLATELGLDYATALAIRHDIETERTTGGQ